MNDNVYALASNALKDAQEEIRKWRIRAEDAEINLRDLQEKWTHAERMMQILNQIIEQKDLAVEAYKRMVADLEGSGAIARYSEEITGLQTKLKTALAFIPRGDSEVFAFDNGDEAEYGQDTPYTEAQLDFYCQAMPIAMACINQIQAIAKQDVENNIFEIAQAAKHAIGKVHERVQVEDDVCQETGKMREKLTWLQEEEDDA